LWTGARRVGHAVEAINLAREYAAVRAGTRAEGYPVPQTLKIQFVASQYFNAK
jgi:hypothetical protein